MIAGALFNQPQPLATTMRKTTAVLFVSILALSACGGEPPDTGPGQPVAHRRAAFKEILKAFEPMGVMLRAEEYNSQRFQTLSQQLMTVRDAPWDYFKAGTQYPPSHSTDAVWNDAAKFAAEKQAFFDATDKLAAVAGTPDEKQVMAAYEAVQNTCKSCHKTFKTR